MLRCTDRQCALKWDFHVSELAKSFTQKLNLPKSLYFLTRQAIIVPILGLFCPLFRIVSNLESIHIRAAKIIFYLDWWLSSKVVLATAKWNTLKSIYEKRLLISAYYHLLRCPMNCLLEKIQDIASFLFLAGYLNESTGNNFAAQLLVQRKWRGIISGKQDVRQ